MQLISSERKFTLTVVSADLIDEVRMNRVLTSAECSFRHIPELQQANGDYHRMISAMYSYVVSHPLDSSESKANGYSAAIIWFLKRNTKFNPDRLNIEF